MNATLVTILIIIVTMFYMIPPQYIHVAWEWLCGYDEPGARHYSWRTVIIVIVIASLVYSHVSHEHHQCDIAIVMLQRQHNDTINRMRQSYRDDTPSMLCLDNDRCVKYRMARGETVIVNKTRPNGGDNGPGIIVITSHGTILLDWHRNDAYGDTYFGKHLPYAMLPNVNLKPIVGHGPPYTSEELLSSVDQMGM